MGRENGVAHQVGNKFNRSCNVAVGEDGVDVCLFLGGEGVEFASDGFHAVAYVGGASAGGAFEYGVFHEMGKSVEVFGFIAATGVDGHTEASHS